MSSTSEINVTEYLARLVRLLSVRQFYLSGLIDEDNAVEILNGCLSPDDESTKRNDSDLLDDAKSMTETEAAEMLAEKMTYE